MTSLYGLHTQTITIPTSKGGYSYRLADYQKNSIGEDITIVAITARINPFFLGTSMNSMKDRPLINQFQAMKGYLSLVSSDNKTIVYKKNLFTLVRTHNTTINYSYIGNGAFDIFIPPCNINWSKSEINFDPSIGFDGSQDIELNVLYQKKQAPSPQANLQLYNGLNHITTKQTTIKIAAKVDRDEFDLSYNNPLKDHDCIIGLRIADYPFTTEDGEIAATRHNFLGSSFINLMYGSSYLLQSYPLIDLQPLQNTNIPFFPIPPIAANKLNWSNSNIRVANKSYPLDNYAYLITLYYQ